MVFTLHRYIFREVFKVFALATIALTLMMSLGSILRPVQEYGVGPRQVLDLMVYFLPITLTLVLPMAALFATTLVYGRLASDNELDACRASGLPLSSLVYPGLLLAIMVSIATLLLSFYVMPAFVHRAESSIKNDARQILFRNIQQKGFYVLPPEEKIRIYADNADIDKNTLWGVIVAETSSTGIKKIITAQSANITFNPHEKFNEVRVTAHNTNQIGPQEDAAFAAEWLSLSAEFGSLMGDNIQFKKIDEMKRIKIDPLLFDPVNKIARKVYSRFTSELLARQINEAISSRSGSAVSKLITGQSFRLNSDKLIVEFIAKNCSVHNEQQIQLADDVMIIERSLSADRPSRTLHCQKAFLDMEGDEITPTLTLDIRNAKWQNEQGVENILSRYIIRGLVLPRSVTEHFKSPNILNDITQQAVTSALSSEPSKELTASMKELKRKITKTRAQIKGEINFRLVFGIGCITLILIGIALGIILKDGHLLTAFAASAVPALVLIVSIMMGKNLTENINTAKSLSGIGLMWSGFFVLCALTVYLYHRLLKN